ncbi:MAG: DUF413 domain-containing protein [Planctomycetes bacterium]|nr:DUF413 domain-containing protein [Planctomycetota bacterium]
MLAACAYMGAVARQSELGARQVQSPSLANLKHLLDTSTHYVYGRVLDPGDSSPLREVAVAACADAFGRFELVDIMHGASVGTHYGLNLPERTDTTYHLLVVGDIDGNGRFDPDEVIGERELSASTLIDAGRVLGNFDLTIDPNTAVRLPAAIELPPRKRQPHSLFYPGGAIRDLDDPIFSPEMAALGIYEPAAFSERAPTMFYALEEDVGFKVPVVFVHGFGGSAREFTALVARLDRRLYKPWFFHYPSGAPLDQLARLFHGIFLSGDAADRDPKVPMVIVAHSMGGLVVREALNLLEPSPDTTAGIRFVSIASPLGGHPAAAAGERHGLIVVPSWRSLAPESDFVRALYRRALPAAVDHHLLFAFHDDGLRFGDNSDGVVPLRSQLRPEAQAEAVLLRGFDATHAGILQDERALAFVVDDIHAVHIDFPPDHTAWLLRGGFACPEALEIDPLARHMIVTVGQYLRALAKGELEPIDDQQRRFVAAVRGRGPITEAMERAWLAFVAACQEPVPQR